MSVLLRNLLVIAAFACPLFAGSAETAKNTKLSPVAVGHDNSHAGRFQIFFSPHARADVYLVDTETGRIWRPITVTNAQDKNFGRAPEVWVYQDRIDNEQEFDVWFDFHTSPAAVPASGAKP